MILRTSAVARSYLAAILWVALTTAVAGASAATNEACVASRLPDPLKSTAHHFALAKGKGSEWVAWADVKLHVMERPRGGDWRPVGKFEAVHLDGEPSLLARPGGDPLLAFMANEPDLRSRLRIYSLEAGGGVVPYGEPLFSGESGRDVYHFALSLNPRGVPVVVWAESEGPRTYWLFAAEWSAHRWVALGKRSLELRGGLSLGELSSAVDADGSVWVVSAFLDTIGHWSAFRLRDGAWTTVPMPPHLGRASDGQVLAIGAKVFYAWLAWMGKGEVRAHVAEFQEGRWESLPIDVAARVFDLGVANGVPFFVWGPTNSAGEIRLRTLSGSVSQEHAIDLPAAAGGERLQNGADTTESRDPVGEVVTFPELADKQGHVEPKVRWPIVSAISAGAGSSVVGWVTDLERGKYVFQYVDLAACGWFQ